MHGTHMLKINGHAAEVWLETTLVPNSKCWITTDLKVLLKCHMFF